MNLFHSPLGLFDFQAEGVAKVYWAWSESSEPVRLALWDTGIGKTVLGLATAAFAFEDDLLDKIVVVADANKVIDWAEVDAPRFTDLKIGKLYGDKKRREKVLADDSQLLVTSWATSRNDIAAAFTKGGRGVAEPGILTKALYGKRVGFIFDEFSALRTRGTKTYIAWDYLVRTLRKTEHQPRMLGLTATTVENNPMDHFNLCRILSPDRAGRVEDFDPQYVAAYDIYDTPIAFKNLNIETMVDSGVVPLSHRFAPITLRKRKTDADVIEQFPSKMENAPTMVSLDSDHQRLYDEIESIFDDESLSEAEQRAGFGLLRMLADHPASLLDSEGKYAKQVVETVGANWLYNLKVAKVDAMLDWQERVGQQQTVIFSFYGNTVLPRLQHALESRDYKVSVNRGAMSPDQRQREKEKYLRGDTQIFLSSDAGAKGLNLGCGSALLHYETPVLYSTYEQRSNRIHRIDSVHPSITIDMLIARDTVEFPLCHKMLNRNEMAEQVQDGAYEEDGDPGERGMRARDRIALLRRAKRAAA